ncbi:hypothetical protein KPH14_013069, partial [Odynerus spinipes]
MRDVGKEIEVKNSGAEKDDKIFSIFCRFRPLNESERAIERRKRKELNYEEDKKLVNIVSKNFLEYNDRPYIFEAIFDETCDQKTFYEKTLAAMVQRFQAEHHDLTIMTYGQTSSGKTWTTDGDFYAKLENNQDIIFLDDNPTTRNFGILPRIIKDLLGGVCCGANSVDSKSESESARPTVKINTKIDLAFYEIYCEKIIDLFRDTNLTGGTYANETNEEIKIYENRSN